MVRTRRFCSAALVAVLVLWQSAARQGRRNAESKQGFTGDSLRDYSQFQTSDILGPILCNNSAAAAADRSILRHGLPLDL